MNNIDKAAYIIENYGLNCTRCNERKDICDICGTRARIAVEELKNAGLLALDLPKPNDPSIFVPNGKGWLPGGPHGPSIWTAPDSRIMVQRIEPGDLTPEETREVAHVLLAAANHAEKEEA